MGGHDALEFQSIQWTVWDKVKQGKCMRACDLILIRQYRQLQRILAILVDPFCSGNSAVDNIFWHVFFFSRCPVDGEIMGQFQYNPSKTTAFVHFQAHKFPYTASVYYQCNVRLCIKADHGCDDVVSVFHLISCPWRLT